MISADVSAVHTCVHPLLTLLTHALSFEAVAEVNREGVVWFDPCLAAEAAEAVAKQPQVLGLAELDPARVCARSIAL